ncbi:MAG: hypothetical protein GC156_02845 [Actinomycetales bacterium]|nr:hypothetical protein [Actinomycetales bacterium]
MTAGRQPNRARRPRWRPLPRPPQRARRPLSQRIPRRARTRRSSWRPRRMRPPTPWAPPRA